MKKVDLTKLIRIDKVNDTDWVLDLINKPSPFTGKGGLEPNTYNGFWTKPKEKQVEFVQISDINMAVINEYRQDPNYDKRAEELANKLLDFAKNHYDPNKPIVKHEPVVEIVKANSPEDTIANADEIIIISEEDFEEIFPLVKHRLGTIKFTCVDSVKEYVAKRILESSEFNESKEDEIPNQTTPDNQFNSRSRDELGFFT